MRIFSSQIKQRFYNSLYVLNRGSEAGFIILALVLALGRADVQAGEVDAAPADAWPMFRGTASLTGVSNSRLSASLKPLWSFKAKEGIHSTAAIAGGTVYVGCDDGNLYALNFKTGSASSSLMV